jgi:hypothetical protein
LDFEALAPIVVRSDGLERPDARALGRRLERGIDYVRLVECRRGGAGDFVVFDVSVETPQVTTHDIHVEERIGAWFASELTTDGNPVSPEVFALREDFPRDVPHVNLRAYVYPKSLCLYDVPFAEVRSTWTPARFVALIREWLRLTAIGELHAADQPLEPLMLNASGWIILPNVLRERDGAFGVEVRGEIGDMPVLVAVPPSDVENAKRRFVVACIHASPRTHGVIRRAATTLAELHDLLGAQDNLRGKLGPLLRQWKTEGAALEAQLAIVLLVPLRREETAEPEIEQPWAFLTGTTLRAVGESLGLWAVSPHGLGDILGEAGDGGAGVELLPLNAHFNLRREDAARYNDRPAADERRFVAIGGGALGSQVLDCVARSAFGRWSVVDGDVLLPHNVARHELYEGGVGWEKARAVAMAMNWTAEDGNVHRGVSADVLAPGDQRAALEQAYAEASTIVDMSASIGVARALARDVDAASRRVSLFVNPTGTDLVILAEPADRSTRLDAIEMQYYRAVATNDALAGTLEGAVSRERYGRSCRDMTSHIPHAQLKLLAGIGATALERVMDDSCGVIRVWRLDKKTLGVASVEIPVARAIEEPVGEWLLVIDEKLLARLALLREENCPMKLAACCLESWT